MTAGGINNSFFTKDIKMKKVFIFTSLLVFSLRSFAGYTIISENEKDIFSGYSHEEREIATEMQRQFDGNGYYNTFSEAAVGLKEVETRKFKGYIDTSSDPYYENLRADTKGFPLNFLYSGIASVPKDQILGYVPSGTEQLKEKNSKTFLWTGVTGYFLDDRFGTCRHSVESFGVDNVWNNEPYLEVKYDASRTTYEINKKPTTKSAEGNEQSGYIYEITWTGKNFDKGLECTNTKPFDPQAIKDLIVLANKIDNDLPDAPK